MIKIGNIIIDERQIEAVYPSLHTEGKLIIALKSGRSVWTMASMEQITMALQVTGGEVVSPKLMLEITMLEKLTALGYYYLARDESGKIFAYEAEPSKAASCWDSENGKTMPVRSDLFDGVVEWQDKEAVEIDTLLEDMALYPERYED